MLKVQDKTLVGDQGEDLRKFLCLGLENERKLLRRKNEVLVLLCTMSATPMFTKTLNH